MNLYFDTSALVKLFHVENGTQSVTDLVIADITKYGSRNCSA